MSEQERTGSTEQTGRSGTPGRYTRSFGGLVGAMLVLLLAVTIFLVFREAFRTTPRFEVEPVDYLEVVEVVQAEDGQIVYPAELPDGWVAKNVQYSPGERPVWTLAMDTADGSFVGIRQEDEDAEDLVEEWIDENAADDGSAEVDSPVATTWQVWSDEGGDLGYSTEVGGQTVLVYGSASAADQEALLALLTTERL